MAPKSQLYGETLIGTPGSGKKLALTFDDGPNPPYTSRLLDLLAKHDVKATFFLIGKYVQQHRKLVRDMIKSGHEVGNHTHSHPHLAMVGKDFLLRELLWCEEAIHMARLDAGQSTASLRTSIGIKDDAETKELLREATLMRKVSGTKYFRPPFGGRNPQTLATARAVGYVPVMWSVTCYDWKQTTASKVEQNAMRQIRGGDIILLHDGGHRHMGADRAHTVEATDRLIRHHKDDGFEFVTVSAMDGGTSTIKSKSP
jgi:peptidoglycan/xylan/chitin deacetylase (PgdA/CDA1 family)